MPAKISPEFIHYAANMIQLASLRNLMGEELFYQLIELVKRGNVEQIAEFLDSPKVKEATIKMAIGNAELAMESLDAIEMPRMRKVN